MRQQLPLQQFDQRGQLHARCARRVADDTLGQLLQPLQHRAQLGVLVAQPLGVIRADAAGGLVFQAAAERAQRVDDHRHVDDLLHDRTGQCRQQAEGGQQHRQQRQTHPGQHALQRHAPCTACDLHRLGDAIQTVGQQHHAGRLGRGGGTARAQRDADVGGGQRRRIVDAVTDHQRDALRMPLRDRGQLVGRGQPGAHLVHAGGQTDRLRAFQQVAGEHHDAADAGLPQQAQRARRFEPQRIVEQHRAGHRAVDADEAGADVLVGHAPLQGVGPRQRRRARGDIVMAAQHHRVPGHHAAQAGAGLLVHLARRLQRQPLRAGGQHDRLRDHMRRGLRQRGGQLQQWLRGMRAGAGHRQHARVAGGERAGLVQKQHLRAGQRLQRGAVLHQNAALRAARYAAHDRHRHREYQRTRRGHHQHRQRAQRIAAEQPGRAGQQQGQRNQDQRIAVGHPHERRTRLPRRLDHPHDAGVGAVRCRLGGAEVERRTGVDATAAHAVAALPAYRQRLAAERGFVQRGGGVQHRAIHRHHFAHAQQQAVARHHRVHRHLLQLVVAIAPGKARGAINQAAQLAPGAAGSVILQRAAAGQHQRDHRRHQRLTQQHRRDDRQQRDQIHPGLAAAQPDRDLHHQQRRHQQRADAPGETGQWIEPQPMQQQSGRQRQCGEQQQRCIEPAAQGAQWQTSTGTLAYSITLCVSLPSSSRSKPRQPCDAITIRSHCCAATAATMAVYGRCSIT